MSADDSFHLVGILTAAILSTTALVVVAGVMETPDVASRSVAGFDELRATSAADLRRGCHFRCRSVECRTACDWNQHSNSELRPTKIRRLKRRALVDGGVPPFDLRPVPSLSPSFPVSGDVTSGPIRVNGPGAGSDGRVGGPAVYDPQSAPRINGTVIVDDSISGSLSAVVNFRLQPPRGSTVQPGGDDQGVVELHWASETCNVLPGYPECDELPRMDGLRMRVTYGQWTQYTIVNLTYNTKYFVSIEMQPWKPKKINFRTPACQRPYQSFRRCERSIENDLPSSANRTSSGRPGLSPPPFANVTVKSVQYGTGSLAGIVSFQLLRDEMASSDALNATVEVHWASKSCNVDPRYPTCSEPNGHDSQKVLASYSQPTNYTIPNLTYNARYLLVLQLTDNSKVKRHRQYFTTPGCHRPYNDKFKQCQRLQRDPPAAVDPSVFVNISCVERRPADASGAANLTASKRVAVWIAWKAPPTPTSTFPDALSSIPSDADLEAPTAGAVVVSGSGGELQALRLSTDAKRMRIELETNQLYEIKVMTKRGEKGFHYEPLTVNVSELLSALSDERSSAYQLCPETSTPAIAAAIGAPIGMTDDRSTPAVVGLVCLASICMAALAAVFYKRCQRRLRSAFLAKTAATMSRSNSYKSSPSGSFHLLRDGQTISGLQLQTMSTVDEWEIDPREVSLGVEIGQGAFGRVLTGYYRDRQVAIKVLKDHIPDSYREDLLREIALMKGVGVHPNIVSMVGACTTRDPIALIMEYMPYGNLQTFLKKCRTDRESHDAADRDNLTYCLMDELTGAKECWCITATDVLSFARQIAVAMEYLSERHFVHRDLAARNILLGCNKVVKVCDFGLARLVYTGDQYCKLTSGRLPLKWMALESIRDRVFTTSSDVWSFGILLWEIVTMGASPYPNIALADVYRLLCEGYRMQQPKNCSDELYDIMSQCWCETPADRPTFGDVRRQLEHLLARDVNYLDLDNIDAPLAPRSQSTADGETTGSENGAVVDVPTGGASPTPSAAAEDDDEEEEEEGDDSAAPLGPSVHPTLGRRRVTTSFGRSAMPAFVDDIGLHLDIC